MENQKLNLPFNRKMRKAAVKVKDAAITNGKQNIIIVAALVRIL